MQTIEAKAILSASDKTGGVFSQIAAKIRGMNQAAAMANRAAAVNANTVAQASRAARIGTAVSTGMGDMAAFRASGLAIGGAAAVVGAGKLVKSYADADLKLRRIGITAEATDKEVAEMGGTLRNVAQQMALPYTQVVDGLESLVAGGMSLKEAMANLPAVAKAAQASGAEVKDMSDSVLALNQNLGIAANEMPKALDAMAKAGKLGKFELKDMAQYFPSIAAQAAAVGVKGQAGLERIAAVMQIIRKDTGKSEEAATNLTNIFAKFQSEETVKKFEKMGVKDLRGDWKKAKEAGQDFFTFVHDEVEKATKGDMDKIPLLFTDMQAQAAVRSIMNHWGDYKQTLEDVKKAHGTVATDLEKVTSSAASQITRLSEAWDRLKVSSGSAIVELSKAMGGKDGGLIKGMEGAGEEAQSFADKGFLGYFKHKYREIADQLGEASRRREELNLEASLERRKNLLERGGQDSESRRQQRLDDAARLIDLYGAQGLVDEKIGPMGSGNALVGRRMFTKEEVEMWRKSGDGDVTTVGKPSSTPMPPVQVTGDLKGQTEVTVNVKVEPTSEFMRAIADAKSAKMAVQGVVRNGPGSTGRSSPDAAPVPQP